MKSERLEPRFVEAMPEDLEQGYLYVSIRFRTAQHLCACGCGSRIVTPIKPAKYALTYDGESVSLWPSVGNWQKPCKSHYVIRNSRVVWYAEWTDRQIERGRARIRPQFGTTSNPAQRTRLHRSRRQATKQGLMLHARNASSSGGGGANLINLAIREPC